MPAADPKRSQLPNGVVSSLAPDRLCTVAKLKRTQQSSDESVSSPAPGLLSVAPPRRRQSEDGSVCSLDPARLFPVVTPRAKPSPRRCIRLPLPAPDPLPSLVLGHALSPTHALLARSLALPPDLDRPEHEPGQDDALLYYKIKLLFSSHRTLQFITCAEKRWDITGTAITSRMEDEG